MSSFFFKFLWKAYGFFKKEAIKNLKSINKIDDSVEISFPVIWVGNISVGKDTYFMPNCEIISGPNSRISIGSNCAIARNVTIRTWSHKKGLPLHRTRNTLEADIVIGNNCWLATNCYIREGVTLGNNCIVAANCVVTRSFPDGSIIAGVPGRLIGLNELML